MNNEVDLKMKVSAEADEASFEAVRREADQLQPAAPATGDDGGPAGAVQEHAAALRELQSALEGCTQAQGDATAAQQAGAEAVDEMQADNPGMSREEAVKATNEKKNRNRQEQIETAADAEYDPAFEGGVCQSVEDPRGWSMCKLGFLAIGKLKVLPNFKIGSDAQTGVVEPLKGDYRADHDPIRVWRRADGSLMVISGRHRLDAAKRAGMDKISAFVYEEGEVHDEQWARRYDIESNIRDNQATALEVALYVRGEWNGGRALSDGEIARAGIARKGKAGAIGCEIARKGAQAVVDAWRNGALTEQQAFWIASFMPGNERAQRAGVGMALSGDVSKGEILTAMEAAEAVGKMGDSLGVGHDVDLFGNELDNDAFLNFVAKYIMRKRNEIGKDLAYIGATATKRNAAEMAKKYGVDIKNPEAMRRKQEELQRLKQRWGNPYTDSELMDEIRSAYRKETLEGWVEDGGAKGAVEGLPGEAEGQGVLFSREHASLRIWNARLHDLLNVQGVVADERAELDMSAYGEVETLDKVQERWNRTLDDYSAGKLDTWDRPLTFGQTPAVLRMLGAPALRMTITRDVLNKVTRDKHSLDIEELRKLPDSMHEPLAVFLSGTQLNSLVVLTEMHEHGKPVVAAIHLDSTQGHLRVNKIASVYGKDNSLGLFSGDILYADKTKIGKWSTTRGLQLPKVVQSISRGRRVLNPGDVVKWKNENNLPQVHFSIFGMTARGAACADERGETYVDPADGKRKWVVSDAESRLRDNFTFGQLNVAAGGHKDTTLGAVLHFPALFGNYPDLERVRVRFYNPQKSDGLGGYFNPHPGDGSAAYIAVNIGACRTPGKVLETLRHESQHWIQSVEGHAMGGGFSTAQEAVRKKKDEERRTRVGRFQRRGDKPLYTRRQYTEINDGASPGSAPPQGDGGQKRHQGTEVQGEILLPRRTVAGECAPCLFPDKLDGHHQGKNAAEAVAP